MGAVRIQVWDKGDPPTGFELGEPPTDFGVGRAAYRWREAKPTDDPRLVSRGRVLEEPTLYRGDALLTRADGTQERLGFGRMLDADEVLVLLKEVAANGLEVV